MLLVLETSFLQFMPDLLFGEQYLCFKSHLIKYMVHCISIWCITFGSKFLSGSWMLLLLFRKFLSIFDIGLKVLLLRKGRCFYPFQGLRLLFGAASNISLPSKYRSAVCCFILFLSFSHLRPFIGLCWAKHFSWLFTLYFFYRVITVQDKVILKSSCLCSWLLMMLKLLFRSIAVIWFVVRYSLVIMLLQLLSRFFIISWKVKASLCRGWVFFDRFDATLKWISLLEWRHLSKIIF